AGGGQVQRVDDGGQARRADPAHPRARVGPAPGGPCLAAAAHPGSPPGRRDPAARGQPRLLWFRRGRALPARARGQHIQARGGPAGARRRDAAAQGALLYDRAHPVPVHPRDHDAHGAARVARPAGAARAPHLAHVPRRTGAGRGLGQPGPEL
ncbi:hypothetical protein H4R21_006826, partial [Coemansia helicoidea]